MMKEALAQMANPIYPITALVIFFGLFVGLLFRLRSTRQEYFDYMASMPLEDKNERE
jgi:hypothetical protein